MVTQIYVEETTGSDTTGDGTVEKPYQTAAYAIFTHRSSAPLLILIRPKLDDEYAEISPSGLRKAKKNAEGLHKKAKKVEELKLKQEQEKGAEAERLQTKLEESKKIILSEDPELPKATKVSSSTPSVTGYLPSIQAKIANLALLRSKRVRVSGWVHRLRDQKGIIFLVIRDGTGYLQTVLSGNLVSLVLEGRPRFDFRVSTGPDI